MESLFRNMKSILETRPIYHKCDDTIRGHVFCSFLGLLLMKELQLRLEKQGHAVEWLRLLDDLEALEEFPVTTGGKTFVVRTATRGDVGKALQAVGVAWGRRFVRCNCPHRQLHLTNLAPRRRHRRPATCFAKHGRASPCEPQTCFRPWFSRKLL